MLFLSYSTLHFHNYLSSASLLWFHVLAVCIYADNDAKNVREWLSSIILTALDLQATNSHKFVGFLSFYNDLVVVVSTALCICSMFPQSCSSAAT